MELGVRGESDGAELIGMASYKEGCQGFHHTGGSPIAGEVGLAETKGMAMKLTPKKMKTRK